MQRFLYQIMAALLLFCGSSAEAKLFNGSEFYLDNGMRVIVIPNHKAPIVKHMVWYKSGAADEPAGKGGIAHLLEHLMFRGTRKVSGGEFNRILEANGAESNAFTAQDMTAYHQLSDISRLELAMALEADRMQNLKIRDKDFELERDIVFQERKERIDNNPAGYFSESLRRSLWQDHPYARPVAGTAPEILGLTRADAEAYYEQHYGPDNAVLVLAGDIEPETARRLAEKYYGKIRSRQHRKKEILTEIKPYMQTMVKSENRDIKGIRAVKMFAAPSYNVNPQDIFNLQVLSAYLGEGETSKLYKKLVLRDQKALAVSTDYDYVSRGPGTFAVSALPAPGISGEELLAEIDKAWAEAMSEFDEAELTKVKQRMLAGLVYLRDDPSDAAYIAGSLAVVGMPLNRIERLGEEIEAVSLEGVRQAAEKLKREAPVVSGILAPLSDKDKSQPREEHKNGA